MLMNRDLLCREMPCSLHVAPGPLPDDARLCELQDAPVNGSFEWAVLDQAQSHVEGLGTFGDDVGVSLAEPDN